MRRKIEECGWRELYAEGNEGGLGDVCRIVLPFDASPDLPKARTSGGGESGYRTRGTTISCMEQRWSVPNTWHCDFLH